MNININMNITMASRRGPGPTIAPRELQLTRSGVIPLSLIYAIYTPICDWDSLFFEHVRAFFERGAFFTNGTIKQLG